MFIVKSQKRVAENVNIARKDSRREPGKGDWIIKYIWTTHD
jgi:hypothetical protein